MSGDTERRVRGTSTGQSLNTFLLTRLLLNCFYIIRRNEITKTINVFIRLVEFVVISMSVLYLYLEQEGV